MKRCRGKSSRHWRGLRRKFAGCALKMFMVAAKKARLALSVERTDRPEPPSTRHADAAPQLHQTGHSYITQNF